MNWRDIDVDFESSDGLTFYEQLLRALWQGAEVHFNAGRYYDATSQWTELQPKILVKLLERTVPIKEASATGRMAAALELLQHIAIELSVLQSRHAVVEPR